MWLSALCLMVAVGFTLTSCDDDDNYDTDQFVGGTALNSYGPSPVARGGELRFIGSGLNKITSVEIPGCEPITDIKRISNGEIRVMVPQTAEPGLVTLNYPNGKIVTKTTLRYTEPISFDQMSPMRVKAGEELVITGEYLNLIHEVIFAEDITVADSMFTAQSRKEIRLMLPAEARSGQVVLSDGQEIPNMLYSAEPLDVVLPSVTNVLDLTNAVPGSTVVAEGADLDLVQKVEMPNAAEVEFTLVDNKISFVLPEDVSDGTIVMIPASGVKVPVATVGVVVPTELVCTPAVDLLPNQVITITGVSLDQVTTLTFPGVDAAVEPESQSAIELTAKVPAMATDGDLVLNLRSGKTVSLPIAMAKPGNFAYDRNPVPAGETLVITGTNMNLVSYVIFGGDVKANPANGVPTKLWVPVPTTAETGAVKFVMRNGMEVEGPELAIDKPTCAWIPKLAARFVAGETVSMPLENADKLTGVTVNGASVEYLRQNGNLLMVVPNAMGPATLKLLSSNGSISYNITIVAFETTIFEGPVDLTWGDDGRFGIALNYFDDAKAGSKLKFYITQNDNWGQIQLNNGSWVTIPGMAAAGCLTTDFIADKTATEVTLVLTQEDIDNIRGNAGDYWGLNTAWHNGDSRVAMVLQGSDMRINKITIIY